MAGDMFRGLGEQLIAVGVVVGLVIAVIIGFAFWIYTR